MAKATKGKWYAAWATPWGPMGAVAGEKGLVRVELPHYALDDLRALLGWEHPNAVEDQAPFALLIERSRDYFGGKVADFSDVAVDLPGEGTFAGKVYRACRAIPTGRSMGYRDLSMEIGREDAARAVATALSKNPTPLVIPCHRVTYADGRPGGFSAAGGPDLKARMLDLERRAASA
jgi:methylated-DNA-[protein]-cysteine S-methyltransferase